MIPEAKIQCYGMTLECDAKTGLTIRHGRNQPGEHPEPATATIDFISPDRSLTELFVLNRSITISGQFGFPGYEWVDRFNGRITDVNLTWDNVDLVNLQVVAVSPMASLNRTYIGDEPWPVESDGKRAERILGWVTGNHYSTSFEDDLDGWTAVDCEAAWADGSVTVTWRGADPLPMQIFTEAITGLIPNWNYTARAEVSGGTGGGFIAAQPGDNFGDACRPGDESSSIAVNVLSDSTGKIDIQFWPYPGASDGDTFIVHSVQVDTNPAPPVSMGDVDPGTVNLLARDVDRQPALTLLQQVAADAGGLVWHKRNGSVCYADAEHRRNIPASLVLDCGQILMSPQWRKTTDGLVNETTVSYGVTPEGGEQPQVFDSSPPSIYLYGRNALHQTTQLAALADAEERARLTIIRQAAPYWNLPAIPIELGLESLDRETSLALLQLELGDLITVTGLPNQGPFTTTSLWVEGWSETLNGPDSWLIDLAVSAYCRTAGLVRWDDIAPETTWDTAPSGMTWNMAGCLGPARGGKRWADVPANVRWNDVGGSVTWDTWGEE